MSSLPPTVALPRQQPPAREGLGAQQVFLLHVVESVNPLILATAGSKPIGAFGIFHFFKELQLTLWWRGCVPYKVLGSSVAVNGLVSSLPAKKGVRILKSELER